MPVQLKQHKASRYAQPLVIKDNTLAPACPDHIARYDKPIKTFAYMINQLNN